MARDSLIVFYNYLELINGEHGDLPIYIPINAKFDGIKKIEMGDDGMSFHVIDIHFIPDSLFQEIIAAKNESN